MKSYFAFPKLPKDSKYSSIFGLVHLICLQLHPERIAIQNELIKIYLEIFTNHLDEPIVAQSNYSLIKFCPEAQLFEIYNFEDFVEFYLPFNQVEDLMKMGIGQELGIGPNKWTRLVTDQDGNLTLSRYRPRDKIIDNIDLPSLSLRSLQDLMFEAISTAKGLGHFGTKDNYLE